MQRRFEEITLMQAQQFRGYAFGDTANARQVSFFCGACMHSALLGSAASPSCCWGLIRSDHSVLKPTQAHTHNHKRTHTKPHINAQGVIMLAFTETRDAMRFCHAAQMVYM